MTPLLEAVLSKVTRQDASGNPSAVPGQDRPIVIPIARRNQARL